MSETDNHYLQQIARNLQTGGSGGALIVNTCATFIEVLSVGNAKVVLPANPNRTSAIFINNGSDDIVLHRGPTTDPMGSNRGIILKANGGVYEINSTNLYRGVVSVWAGTGAVTGEECS
ncbi:hypothetical protein IQ268_08540 [Oculatella sp. LEGE 06141]|uniref:hypothetical protein n=1 Tax=Oculatella sp. LEGE 06141 TaxID=1828648 RepID=UPI001881860C|nr:hypothetical protein [Oculatella sp. LEGE 06141]MBE9178605.1 hypothetical protein [Oculatella sp. LEGE 06141]